MWIGWATNEIAHANMKYLSLFTHFYVGLELYVVICLWKQIEEVK